MEASTLRLILIVAGVLIIGGILLFGNPERKKHRHASRRERLKENEAEAAELEESADPDGVQQELKALGELIAQDRDEKQQEEDEVVPVINEPPPPKPDKIVSLCIQSSGNGFITGVELLDAAMKAGLEFGDMEVFHRYHQGDKRPVFSMANMLKPGHFDKTAWNSFETTGVTLFLTLPGPMPGLDAWDTMLATGQRLAKLLNAELLDGKRMPITRQSVAEIREEMREYDRLVADKQ